MFTKGLPHNDLGEVDRNAFGALLTALASGAASDLAAVPVGTPGARLVNSRAGFNFSLIGQDSQGLVVPAAPGFSSAETGADMVEAYWAAMTRDVPFANYSTDATIAQAAAGCPRNRATPVLTPEVLLGQSVSRGLPWCAYRALAVTQFFWMPLIFGAYSNEQVLKPPLAGVDYSASYADWLLNQRGGGGGPTAAGTTPRYISNARDLSRALQLDVQLGVDSSTSCRLSSISIACRCRAIHRCRRSRETTMRDSTSSAAPCSRVWSEWRPSRRCNPCSGRSGKSTVASARKYHARPRAQPHHRSSDVSSVQRSAQLGGDRRDLQPQRHVLAAASLEKGGCPIHPAYPSAHGVNTGAAITLIGLSMMALRCFRIRSPPTQTVRRWSRIRVRR